MTTGLVRTATQETCLHTEHPPKALEANGGCDSWSPSNKPAQRVTQQQPCLRPFQLPHCKEKTCGISHLRAFASLARQGHAESCAPRSGPRSAPRAEAQQQKRQGPAGTARSKDSKRRARSWLWSQRLFVHTGDQHMENTETSWASFKHRGSLFFLKQLCLKH